MTLPTIRRLQDEDTGSDYRATLVDALQYAAGLLCEVGAPDLNPPLVAARLATADKLLEAAAGLCEHCRVLPSGRCRYCHAVVVEV